MKSLSYNTKTRFAVYVVGILYENIPLTEMLSSLQGNKEMHACLLLSWEALHVLGFAWHA